MGEGLEVVVVDDYSNEPHGIELSDPKRWVKAILWHPEQTFMDEMYENYDKSNIKLMEAFINVCRKYKSGKSQGNIKL